ncbi:MAG: AraC family transcriptional regulator, partial [Gemmatimonadetes bacterium]|nr:AraC family transcriptional regulator [Gemmatimonadota bacterium]
YQSAHLEARWPHFIGVAYPLPFLYGPLMYLYSAAAADRTRRLTWRDATHFLPFVIVVLWGLPIYLLNAQDKIALYQRLVAGESTTLTSVADPLKFVSGLGYGVATMLLLQRHRQRVKDSYSSIEHVTLRWLAWLGAAALGIWGMATAFDLLRSLGVASVNWSDQVISLCVAALVCAIGYLGLRQPEVFRFETAEYPVAVAPGGVALAAEVAPAGRAVVEEPAERDAEANAARYERSGLSDVEARRLKGRLLALMEQDRPWTDSALTLATLAARLSTTPHKLSEVLNAEVGETFYDFVNGYRVREVQRRLVAGEGRTLKLLALALDAGFSSKSTFNQVFKKHTNQTPSEFRESNGL